MKTFYTILGTLLISSCVTNQKYKTKINLASAFNQPTKEIVVQDLFNEVKYVPLETNDRSSIGENPNIQIVDNYILVAASNQNLKLFNRNTGKYICEIGHIGKDPQGYMALHGGKINFWVDESQKIIYFLGWNNDFVLYDFEGNFKDKISMGDQDHSLSSYSFVMDADEVWGHNKIGLDPNAASLFHGNAHTLTKSDISAPKSPVVSINDIQQVEIVTDYITFGGTSAMFSLTQNRKMNQTIGSPSIWKSDNTIRYKEAFNDTIYNVTQTGITPYLILDLGKWHWDQAKQFEVDGSEKKIAIDYLLESNQYIYLHFNTGLYSEGRRQTYCGFYNKADGKVSVVKGDSLLDTENGQHLQLRRVCQDGSFIALLPVNKLSAKTLNQLQIKKGDNPVVAILR